MQQPERERVLVLWTVYGLRLQVMWEHDWTEMKKSNSEVIEFLKSFNAPEPLSPRQALYGGQTCALRLRYTAGVDETVYYADFTSLYPYVNCSFPYPLGHPKIICKDFDDPDSYFGFIRAVVYPPCGLFFPVLPYKSSHGKLVFTLCRTCAEMNNQAGACSHIDEKRALTGVWVSVAFSKALKLGYRLAKITEVWHFDRSSSSIFVDYVHTFLKGKQEASGYPADALDEESKLRYVRDYKLHQGIQLDTSKIEVNPAKRQMAKLCLNSFWGKFAQRNDLHQTTIITDPNSFFNFMFSGKYKIAYFHFLNPARAHCSGQQTIQRSSQQGKQCILVLWKKVSMRVKSITQTHECSEVNFDSVKELVEGYLADSREMVIETPQRTIRRDKKGLLLKCNIPEKVPGGV